MVAKSSFLSRHGPSKAAHAANLKHGRLDICFSQAAAALTKRLVDHSSS